VNRINLLLVEDDLTDQLSFKRFVKHQHLPYDFDVAGSVAEAIERLSANTYDIIIADHVLGDGIAFDLFEYIPFSTTSVIFVTGNGNEDTAVQALKTGASDYLTKDIEGNYLTLLPLTIEHVLKAKADEIELERHRYHLEQLVAERTRELKQEIAKREEVEQQLRLLAVTFESHEAIVITDDKAKILRVNKAFTLLTGYSAEEALGKNMRLISSGKQDPEFYKQFWKELIDTKQYAGEIWNRRKSGEFYPQWLTVSGIADAEGITTHYVGHLVDITQHKNAELEIRKLAFYDPLTGLANRRLLLDRLRQQLVVAKRNKDYGAIIFLDLDEFKLLNDTYGHHVGDDLLIQVASRLCSVLREEDTASRLGGDEFVILISAKELSYQKARDNAMIVATKIQAALNEVYLLNNVQHHFTSSMGVAIFPEQHADSEEIIKSADKAMYQSKRAGRNIISVFHETT
jgi:diguanylate cyclase (GGDEF)-like protein/PAS domain S-box-containing protein